jgi:hypothetical protein
LLHKDRNQTGPSASRFVPQEDIEFTFDQHPETEYNTGLMYQHVTNQGIFPLIAEKISFATRRDTGIQVADLWVREVMKRSDGFLLDDSFMERIQWLTLWESKRFSAMLLNEPFFAELKLRLENMEANFGVSRAEYRAWLATKKRQNNRSNLFQYLIETDPADEK